MANYDSDELRRAVQEALTLMRASMANPMAMSRELVEIWVLVVTDAGMSPADIRATTVKVVRTEKFFPTPSVFVLAWQPKVDEDTAGDLVWHRTRTCLQDLGSQASLTAADLGGDQWAVTAINWVGWERMGELCDERTRPWYRLEIIRAWRLAKSLDIRSDYVVGRCERENVNAGRGLSPRLCGRPDWKTLPQRTLALPEASAHRAGYYRADPPEEEDEAA
jgi:hypothetical protein